MVLPAHNSRAAALLVPDGNPSLAPAPPPRVQVEGVDCSGLAPGGVGQATVVAMVDESADLWATSGKKADSYRSTYRVEYKVARGAAGGWRVASALVLGK